MSLHIVSFFADLVDPNTLPSAIKLFVFDEDNQPLEASANDPLDIEESADQDRILGLIGVTLDFLKGLPNGMLDALSRYETPLAFHVAAPDFDLDHEEISAMASCYDEEQLCWHLSIPPATAEAGEFENKVDDFIHNLAYATSHLLLNLNVLADGSGVSAELDSALSRFITDFCIDYPSELKQNEPALFLAESRNGNSLPQVYIIDAAAAMLETCLLAGSDLDSEELLIALKSAYPNSLAAIDTLLSSLAANNNGNEVCVYKFFINGFPAHWYSARPDMLNNEFPGPSLGN